MVQKSKSSRILSFFIPLLFTVFFGVFACSGAGVGGGGPEGGGGPGGGFSPLDAPFGNPAAPDMMGTKPDDPSIEVKLSVARQLLCLHESGSQTLVDPDTVLPWDLPALGGLTLKCSVQIKLTRNSPEWVLNLGGRPVRVIYQPDLNDDPTKFKYIDARVFEVIDSGDVNLKLSNLPFGPGLVSFYLYEMGGSVKNPYAAPPGYSEAVAQFSSKKDYDDFFQGPPPAAPSIHHLGSFRLGSINP